jgi:hypothetical protein
LTQATLLIAVDGIVRDTAKAAVGDTKSVVEKAQKLFEWVVQSAYREPKARGCGEGDIAVMLESGNPGGKCVDLNALFVGLCRAVGLPTLDVCGLRAMCAACARCVRPAPGAKPFWLHGYKKLGSIYAKLQGAQHCRGEVHLAGFGWVAMDPADVDKVMRQETARWIKNPRHSPLPPPVASASSAGSQSATLCRLPGP